MFQVEKTYTHWSWERISRHVLYWLVWLLFYVITNSTHHNLSAFSWTGLELLIMCVKLPVTYFVLYVLVPKLLLPKKYLSFLAAFLGITIVGGLVIWMMYFFIFNPHFFNYYTVVFWDSKISYKIVDLIYIVCVPIMIKMYQRQSLQEKRATQLIEQKLGAELKILKNQLHPHFLFNTLNNLYALVLTNHPKAADVVVRLSDMMSYMLYECERPLIDLQKEINNLNNYIELEKIRYGKRLDISFETGGEINDKFIAPLLLLPFFENAFKHGVEKNEQLSWVRVNLWVKGDQLKFMIENSLPEEVDLEMNPKVQSGVGLKNVKKRLELLYPNQYTLEIKREETYLVNLNLKLANELPHS